MTELEKRRRFQRFMCWGYTPFMVGSWLVLRAFRLHDGVISVSDFLWYAALAVPALFVAIIIPFTEDRRLRRLAEERRARRQPALVLDS
ncbi:hypothetical protein [Caulobacter sp. UC70_42]|uniref:hypothetical protein n=1 Tax=Caulobacter sp. UC70_42 TaxID=3374551 RepID=UPI003756AAB4